MWPFGFGIRLVISLSAESGYVNGAIGWPGSSTKNEVPGGCPPGTVSAIRIMPPCLTTTCFTIASPSPEPGIARAEAER